MPSLLTVLLGTVVELLQHSLQLCGDRQAEVRRVLHKGNALIGQIEENDGGAQDTSRAEDLQVLRVRR